MGRTISFVIAIVVFLFAISLLVVYNTQDFKESFNFKDKIDYSQIEIQKNLRGEESYLSLAKAEVGRVVLENEGIFTQVYTFPLIVGCIDLKQGVNEKELAIRNYQFNVQFLKEGVTYSPRQRIEIPVSKKQSFVLVGTYTTYDVPLSAFSRENIKSISLYRIENKNQNPINNNYYYYESGYYGQDNCNYLRESSEPIETIALS
ncbi:hypothetical protein J4461_00805 [Candidatus Pacearchaeota archaeon]|nr:hypothetical protein [Candidatus Pacearchaeota archaeon]